MEMLQITHSFDKFVHSFKEEIAFFFMISQKSCQVSIVTAKDGTESLDYR